MNRAGLAWMAAGWLGGCFTSPCGRAPADSLVESGSYLELSAENTDPTTSGSTPFEQPEVSPLAALEVTDDAVELTYADADGREVLVTYDIVGRSF